MQHVVSASHLSLSYGSKTVLKNASFKVKKGDVFAIVGNSGSGKSTLLKALVGLKTIDSGKVLVFEEEVSELRGETETHFCEKIGFLFQEGALLGNLTVIQNIALPLNRLFQIPLKAAHELAYFKLKLVGLQEDVGALCPSNLSGGMRKRVGLARALALDPSLIFLDEPTAGLDPEASAAFDNLILTLKQDLHLTVVLVTHDLSTVKNIATCIGFVGNQEIICGTLLQMRQNKTPHVQHYFHSPRAEEIFASL